MSTESKLEEIIAEKSGGSASVKIGWQNALKQCQSSGMPDRVIESVFTAFLSPYSIGFLCQLVVKDSEYINTESFEKIWNKILICCDDSNYSVDQWFKGIECVLTFAKRDGIQTQFSTVLGYLTCAEEFAYSTGDSQSLDRLVSTMLEQYGFDG